MKIAIIGAGSMGGAMARGFSKTDLDAAVEVRVSNPSTAKLKALQAACPRILAFTDNRQAAQGADLVILAVKPWKLQGVIDELKPVLDYRTQTVASVAGGVGLDALDGMLRKADDDALPYLYYIIPNTGASVGQSMTFIASRHSTAEADQGIVRLFQYVGEALLVEEWQMAAGTALASCGIAYAMRYIRAAMEGGVELGLPAKVAQQAVMQTLLGAVELLRATGSHPEQEVDRVTTPGGLTIRGLNAMERFGFTTAVIEGLKASVNK